MHKVKILLIFISLFLSSCISYPNYEERKDSAASLAQENGWRKDVLKTDFFDLTAYLPRKITYGENLTIYIEGDGFSWVSSSKPSSNPTPVNPLGLKLAFAHNDGNVAYIARPCQYAGISPKNCRQKFWTNKRFSSEVINSTSNAIDILKERFRAKRLTIVGFSGGGAVAALLAAKRKDVVRLITIAGNLDHHSWTKYHKISPLVGSENPIERVEALEKIPQVHFVGATDKVIPSQIIEGFVSRFSNKGLVRIVTIPEYNHHCCWVENWRHLWSRYVSGDLITQPSNWATDTPF